MSTCRLPIFSQEGLSALLQLCEMASDKSFAPLSPCIGETISATIGLSIRGEKASWGTGDRRDSACACKSNVALDQVKRQETMRGHAMDSLARFRNLQPYKSLFVKPIRT